VVPTFSGFSPAAFDFYEGLEADNTKTYWADHKAVFDEHVKGAMQQLLDSLPKQYQPFRVFRPNRDVRFAKDKSPYKTQHGAVSESTGQMMHYVHLSAAGVFVAAGGYMLANDQVDRLRIAIDHAKTGPALERIIATLEKKDITVGPGGNDPLKTTPKGYAKDHPRSERLRWKGCIASVQISHDDVLLSAVVRDEVVAFWKMCGPLLTWLDTNVGPSELPQHGR
jgi:uncharacterized protein (TIGR02453 family)